MRHGFLLIDKPLGPTSHDVVSMMRKKLNERSIGHLGTLDPAASGLLVLAVGKKALKVIELFGDLEKTYVADIAFGKVSSTYDQEGAIEESPVKPGWSPPERSKLEQVIGLRFMGKHTQRPPAFSAVHVQGKRAHVLARQGIAVDMPSRTVEIGECEILRYDYPHLQLRVRCSSGTFIRSLAHDLGGVLGCGAYLSGLRRTAAGQWSIDAAVHPDRAAWSDIVPLKDILTVFPRRDVSAQEWQDLQHGKVIDGIVQPNTFAWHDGLPVALLRNVDGEHARARKVL